MLMMKKMTFPKSNKKQLQIGVKNLIIFGLGDRKHPDAEQPNNRGHPVTMIDQWMSMGDPYYLP